MSHKRLTTTPTTTEDADAVSPKRHSLDWWVETLAKKEDDVGFLKQLGKVAARTVTLPVSVAKDVVTLGGVLDDDEVATTEHLKKLYEDVTDLPDSVDEED